MKQLTHDTICRKYRQYSDNTWGNGNTHLVIASTISFSASWLKLQNIFLWLTASRRYVYYNHQIFFRDCWHVLWSFFIQTLYHVWCNYYCCKALCIFIKQINPSDVFTVVSYQCSHVHSLVNFTWHDMLLLYYISFLLVEKGHNLLLKLKWVETAWFTSFVRNNNLNMHTTWLILSSVK